MDVFDEEIINFWKALQNNQVQYILIGGFAMNLHGYSRFTDDLDIWLKDTLANRQALRAAFVSYGLGDYPMIEYIEFVAGWSDFHLGNNLRLDILIEMKGLESYSFDECLKLAAVADIEGAKIPVLHINQLIQNKKTVNRPKDQLDVIALERILDLKKDEE